MSEQDVTVEFLELVVKERDQCIADLQAQLSAALRDQRRYLWLRAGDNDELVLRIFSAADDAPSRLFDPRFDSCYLPRDEHLDSAIDSAMEKQP